MPMSYDLFFKITFIYYDIIIILSFEHIIIV